MKPILLLLISTALFLVETRGDEEKGELTEDDYPVAIVQNWLHQNSEVVEICVFREQWIAPTAERQKGMLVKFATITRLYKGSVKVGERVTLAYLFEYPAGEWEREARRRPSRVSMVDGELMVSMFDKEGIQKRDGYWDTGDIISRFPFGSDFHRTFESEEKRDSKLEGAPH